jgi:hypothetical protein
MLIGWLRVGTDRVSNVNIPVVNRREKEGENMDERFSAESLEDYRGIAELRAK